MVNATPSSYPKKAELWGLEVQLSSETACLACSRPWVQSPALQKGKKKKKKRLNSGIFIIKNGKHLILQLKVVQRTKLLLVSSSGLEWNILICL
jgi:hypothetical protein